MIIKLSIIILLLEFDNYQIMKIEDFISFEFYNIIGEISFYVNYLLFV